MNCWMDTNSFPTRTFSQCSLMLNHLIRTSPIGTREVSRTWVLVRNISLFTDSLSFVYFLFLYIFVFLIFSFFYLFFFQFKKIFFNKNELFEWIQTLSQPRSFSQCLMGLQHLNKYCVVLAGKNQKDRLLAQDHQTHVSSAATQDQKVWRTQQSYLKRDPTILYLLLNGQ